MRSLAVAAVRHTSRPILRFTNRFLNASPKSWRDCYEYAQARELSASTWRSLNTLEFSSSLKHDDIDVLFCCSCSERLAPKTLASPRVAAINFHPSLLPRHRGPVPLFWTLFEGDTETGVTFHLMNEEFDDGELLSQFEVPLTAAMTETELSEKLFALGARFMDGIRQVRHECTIFRRSRHHQYVTWDDGPKVDES